VNYLDLPPRQKDRFLFQGRWRRSRRRREDYFASRRNRPACWALPEERLADALDYLAELQDGEEPLSPETEAAIEEDLDDLRRARLITLEECKPLTK
jgi:hypothetical protein